MTYFSQTPGSGVGTYAGAARRRVHLATVLLRPPSGHCSGTRQVRHVHILHIGLRLAIAQTDARPAMTISFRQASVWPSPRQTPSPPCSGLHLTQPCSLWAPLGMVQPLGSRQEKIPEGGILRDPHDRDQSYSDSTHSLVLIATRRVLFVGPNPQQS